MRFLLFFLLLSALAVGSSSAASAGGLRGTGVEPSLTSSYRLQEKEQRRLMGGKCTAAEKQRGVGGCGAGRGNTDNNVADNSNSNSNSDSSDSNSGSTSTSNDNSVVDPQDTAQQLAPPRVQTPVYHKNHGNNLAVEDSYYGLAAHTEKKQQNKALTRRNRNRYGNYVVDKKDKAQKYKNRLDGHQGLTQDAAVKRQKKKKKKKRQHDQLIDRPQEFGGDDKRKADYDRYWSNGGTEMTMDEYRRKFGRQKRTTMLQYDADERARIRKEDDELEAIYDRDDERDDASKLSKKQVKQKAADDKRKKEILDGRAKALKAQQTANKMVSDMLKGFDSFMKKKTQQAFDEAFNDKLSTGDVGIQLQKEIDVRDKNVGLAISAPAQTKPEDYSQEWKDKEKEKKEKRKKKAEERKNAAAAKTTNP